MKSIELRNIKKTFGSEVIFEDFNLFIPSGKFFALLGPSGCGKTTILRLIAGFEKPISGSLLLGGTDITDVPINQRKINTVFQNYALFPHMNVFDNVAYSLSIKQVPKEEIKERVHTILSIVNLERFTYKAIQKLSGGQQQRVALARAIINEPDVLLLDEPLAALDLRLRERVLVELVELQDQLGTTFVYVTHDQSEALTVADEMAILGYEGIIEQQGTPKEVYEYPSNSFVAKFVGTTNTFRGHVSLKEEKAYMVVEQIGELEVSIDTVRSSWITQGAEVVASLRPEKIFIAKRALVGFSNSLRGKVTAVIYHGRSTEYRVVLANGALFNVFEQNEEHVPIETIGYDDIVTLYWRKDSIVLLPH